MRWLWRWLVKVFRRSHQAVQPMVLVRYWCSQCGIIVPLDVRRGTEHEFRQHEGPDGLGKVRCGGLLDWDDLNDWHN